MIVLIDAGNTRVKFGWVEPDTGQREPVALALHHLNLDQLTDWLAQLPRPPTTALGVNVAGQAVAATLQALFDAQGCPISWITGQKEIHGIRNGYHSPGQLGPDRWISMAGVAHNHLSRPNAAPGLAPLMLATFGTATTIDTLIPSISAPHGIESHERVNTACNRQTAPNAESQAQQNGWVFLGGLIFPGPALMRTALAQGTANLPHADGDMADYPANTHQAISTGIAAAQAGALIRQWLLGLQRCGRAPRVYAAGGGWPAVQEETQRLLADMQARSGQCATSIEWLATPVLDGLAATLAPGTHTLRARHSAG